MGPLLPFCYEAQILVYIETITHRDGYYQPEEMEEAVNDQR